MDRNEYSFLSSPLEPHIFISWNFEEYKRMKLDLMKFSLKLLKYLYIFNILF